MNVIEYFLGKYEQQEPFTALVFEGKAYSNVECNLEARRFAGGLKNMGHKPGDIVATILPNCAEIMPVYEGILRRGGVLLPIIFALTASEIAYILGNSGARIIVTNDELLEKVTEAMSACSQEFEVVAINAKKTAATIPYEDFLEKSQVEDTIIDRAGEDLAVLMYTSGTTGKPKGVMLTQDNFIFAMDSPFWNAYAPKGAVTLVALPMNHIFGFTTMIIVVWKRRGTLILHGWFDAARAIEDIQKYKIVYVPVVPTMLLAILNQEGVEAYDLSSVNVWEVAAAPFPAHKISEVEQRLGGTVVHGYGLTETTAVAAHQSPDDVRKPGSAGKPFPGTELKIMTAEGGEAFKSEWGEICIQAPNVMKGYLNRPEATNDALKDGWLHTGDIGYLDEDGHLYVTDRIKDMVLRGGENIYSIEVEDAIYKHPAVAEAAVVGIPDEKYGEEVFAFVVLREGVDATAEDILSECQKHIPKYKCPKRIAFEQSFPKTSTGKILKRTVREKAREFIATK